MGSVVDSYCKGCQYLSTVSGGRNCNYNFITGRLRGCPAGKGCKRHTNPVYAYNNDKAPAVKKTAPPPKPSPKRKRPVMTPEEAYEREKYLKREAAKRFREKAQGKQRAAIMEYKEKTGESNVTIAAKVGISESQFQKWVLEYVPANWDKLAIVGIKKPEGLE